MIAQEKTNEAIELEIKNIIEKDIRPVLAMDGGDVAFCGFEDGTVKVQLQGACQGCPGAAMTLKMGIEQRLKEVVPEVQQVVQV
jgi:Fe-S cluster biogenesis protein NfuA